MLALTFLACTKLVCGNSCPEKWIWAFLSLSRPSFRLVLKLRIKMRMEMGMSESPKKASVTKIL